jgi:hypothetical protein
MLIFFLSKEQLYIICISFSGFFAFLAGGVQTGFLGHILCLEDAGDAMTNPVLHEFWK